MAIVKKNKSMKEILDEHIKNDADCTIAVINVPIEEASRFGIMTADKNGKILEFEEKTEKATPKKRKDTRKKGDVLQSKEVAVAVFVVGIFAFLAIFGNYMFQMLLNFMEQSMTSIDKTGNTVEFAMSVFWKVAIICVCTVGPILAVGVVLSVLPVIVQTKGLFSMEAMKPKFSRLNPFTGIKRLFSMQALVGLVKGLIEIIVVVAILYFQVMDRINEFKKLIDTDVIKIVAYISKTAMSLIVTIFVMLVFVAVADYVFQWWSFEKKLKMSKQEVKDEYKQLEGDPQIKGKIKRKQQEMAQQRMMQEVPSADVVVRNPTHYAVPHKPSPALLPPQCKTLSVSPDLCLPPRKVLLRADGFQ